MTTTGFSIFKGTITVEVVYDILSNSVGDVLQRFKLSKKLEHKLSFTGSMYTNQRRPLIENYKPFVSTIWKDIGNAPIIGHVWKKYVKSENPWGVQVSFQERGGGGQR